MLKICHCGRIAPAGQSACAEHQQERHRSPASRARGSTHAWRKFREQILARDRHVCRYCGAPADTVDHVTPISKGGAEFDPANCVAACGDCNRGKGAAAIAWVGAPKITGASGPDRPGEAAAKKTATTESARNPATSSSPQVKGPL